MATDDRRREQFAFEKVLRARILNSSAETRHDVVENVGMNRVIGAVMNRVSDMAGIARWIT